MKLHFHHWLYRFSLGKLDQYFYFHRKGKNLDDLDCIYHKGIDENRRNPSIHFLVLSFICINIISKSATINVNCIFTFFNLIFIDNYFFICWSVLSVMWFKKIQYNFFLFGETTIISRFTRNWNQRFNIK